MKTLISILLILFIAMPSFSQHRKQTRETTYTVCDWLVKVYDRETRELIETKRVNLMWNWDKSETEFDTVVFYKNPQKEVGDKVTRKHRGFRVEKIKGTCIKKTELIEY